MHYILLYCVYAYVRLSPTCCMLFRCYWCLQHTCNITVLIYLMTLETWMKCKKLTTANYADTICTVSIDRLPISAAFTIHTCDSQ